MKALIAIVGQSGSGKSTSLRNLNPKTTCIIDCERKGFPFSTEGWNVVPAANVGQFDKALAEALANKAYDVIVIESFTKLIEHILVLAEQAYKGWDIWTWYNKKVGDVIEKCKNPRAIVIFTAIDEIVLIPTTDGNQEAARRIAVSGKKWEGKIDKEFLAVLYCKAVRNKQTGKMEYLYLTNSDGVTTAKTPFQLGFPEFIPNDIAAVIAKGKEVYGKAPEF